MTHGPSFFRLARRSLMLWVGALFLLIGSVSLNLGIEGFQQEEQYRQEGVVAPATVLSKSIERAKRGENSRTKYLVTYRFRSGDGRELESTDEVSVEEWERLEAGSRFPVRYLPHTPQSNRHEGKSDSGKSVETLVVGGVFCALGFGLLVWRVTRIRRELRLWREGSVAEGTVLNVGPTATNLNNVRQWQLHYRYRDHLGRIHEGRSGLLSPEEASVWHEGETGTVCFDQLRPQDSIWAGKA